MILIVFGKSDYFLRPEMEGSWKVNLVDLVMAFVVDYIALQRADSETSGKES
jgi:hypothetical protein